MKRVKEILDKIKDSGLVAWGLFAAGVFLYLNGYPLFAGLCGGFWLKSNWDIISDFFEKETGINI